MAKLTKRISGNETAFPRREKAAKTPEQALRLLMNLCAKSEKCTSDARKALYRWGVDPSAHESIIRKLTEQKFDCRSPLRRPHSDKISHKLRLAAHEKPFSDTL